MYTLGINVACHDSSACLVKDGVVRHAAEEEEFTGIRHARRPVPFSTYELPFHEIEFCLRAEVISLGGRFFRQRLRGTSRRPEDVAEMALTSALIPPVSVFWRLAGALRFRVPFL